MNPLCKDVCNLLPLYIDNMLSDEEMTQVSEHLATCNKCQKEYKLLKGILQQTANLPEFAVSEAFSANLHQELEKVAAEKRTESTEQQQTVGKPSKRWRFVSVAAACAAAIAVSVTAWSRLPDTNQFMTQKTSEASQPSKTEAPEEKSFSEAQASAQSSEEAQESAKPEESPIVSQAENLKTDEKLLIQPFEQDTESTKKGFEAKSASKEDTENAQKETTAEKEKEQAATNIVKDESSVPESTNDAIQAQSIEHPVATSFSDREAAVSGSGGSSSGAALRSAKQKKSVAAKVTPKTVTTKTFYFEPYALEEAQNCMAGIPLQSGAYVLSSSLLESYSELLRIINGYCSSETAEQDYTARYSELLSEAENGSQKATQEMQEIDQKIMQSYIIICSK